MSKGFASSYRIVLLAVAILVCFTGLGARLVFLRIDARKQIFLILFLRIVRGKGRRDAHSVPQLAHGDAVRNNADTHGAECSAEHIASPLAVERQEACPSRNKESRCR